MNFGRWIGLIVLLISLYILWQIRQLLLLLLTAVVIATALNRLVLQLQRLNVKRGWAVLITLTSLLALLVGFFVLIVPAFIEQFQQLIALLPTGLVRIQTWLSWLELQIVERFPNLPGNLPDISSLIQQIQPIVTQLLGQSVNFFSTSITALLQFLLVLVLTLMLLAQPQPYRQSFIRLFPSFYRRRVDEILTRCDVALGSWAVGAVIEGIFIAVLSGLGLWIIGVPLALAHAMLAGLLNFIPNIGPTLSAVFPIAIALLDAPWKSVAVLILYIVIQNIESYWLTPLVMAHQVALLPAITLTAQLLFAGFFGALGLLMALPLTVIAKTWLEEVLFIDILDKWRHPQAKVMHEEVIYDTNTDYDPEISEEWKEV
ncbi:AI-2E family transporter [Gloeocapsopsis crepidinum LEGE 06123]|uniref:AI-2E family transporter n=1 Tax=Gloeocapsopsis crepidinum LEGE 06123 TaxID=588587 RepID=A0ABR9ULC8_9CHRO|nr:AI-2E family transporter [Gloeocapsopsis crepidinum]MBE9189089.1 AI-2E family transporter [Gloeocapsopsis crepidinum LEGE 06123]